MEEILKKRGLPEKTSLEDMDEGLREMGIKVWRRKAQDRNDRVTIVSKALALYGL